MTRTERASYPRALMKDRSESRSGLATNIRKSGGGQHNWGKINDEFQNEALADEEVRREEEEEGLSTISPPRERSPDATLANRITVVRSGFKSFQV
ncbi:hypothetical protein CPB84DRAFT_1781921 [Gymnopilus junonius]|uniref:Hyaluronan/mRNA-binding protein domain-containing protein n=1 Tax=Gymnopilus junonius TaxID=109634 RepID=A0A9P5TMP0_GYMJU|nr:hypothetical protein CPB84DRAFT_1781921 [Gymnopilus junonius]